MAALYSTDLLITLSRPAVNFINVKRANFLYESSFKAKT